MLNEATALEYIIYTIISTFGNWIGIGVLLYAIYRIAKGLYNSYRNSHGNTEDSLLRKYNKYRRI